jgi:hypothetical protein
VTCHRCVTQVTHTCGTHALTINAEEALLVQLVDKLGNVTTISLNATQPTSDRLREGSPANSTVQESQDAQVDPLAYLDDIEWAQSYHARTGVELHDDTGDDSDGSFDSQSGEKIRRYF